MYVVTVMLIFFSLTGYETEKAWRKEGQKLATTNPRFVSHPASHIPQVLTVATLTAAMGQKGGASTLKATPTPGLGTEIDFKKVSLQLQNALKLVMSQNPSLPAVSSRASSLSQESKALTSLRPQSAPVTPVKVSASPSVATPSPSKNAPPTSTQSPLKTGTVTCKLTGTKVVASIQRKTVTTTGGTAPPTVRVVTTNSQPVKAVKSERLSNTDAPSPKRSKLSAIESLLCEETISPRNSPGPAKPQVKDEVVNLPEQETLKVVEKPEVSRTQIEKKEVIESSAQKDQPITLSKSTDQEEGKENKFELTSDKLAETTTEKVTSESTDKLPATCNVATIEEKTEVKSDDLTSDSAMDTTSPTKQSTRIDTPSLREPTTATEGTSSSIEKTQKIEETKPPATDEVKVSNTSRLPSSTPPPSLPPQSSSSSSPPPQSLPSPSLPSSPPSISTITSATAEKKQDKPALEKVAKEREENATPSTVEVLKPSPPTPAPTTTPTPPPAQQIEDNLAVQRLARKRSPSPSTRESPPPAKKQAVAPQEDVAVKLSSACPASVNTATLTVTQASSTPTVTVVTLASSTMTTDSPLDLPPSSSTPKIDISSPAQLPSEVNTDSLIQSLCSDSNSFEEDPDVTVLASQLGLDSLDSPVFNLSGFLSLIQPDLSVLKPDEQLPSATGRKMTGETADGSRTDVNAPVKKIIEGSKEHVSCKSKDQAEPKQPLISPSVSETIAPVTQVSSMMSVTREVASIPVAGTTTALVLSTSLPPPPKLTASIDTAPPLSLPPAPESIAPPSVLSPAIFPEDSIPSRPVLLKLSGIPSVTQSQSSLTSTPATPPPPLTPTPLTPLGEGLLDLSDIQSLMDESEVMEGISQDVVESISKLVDLDEQSTNATWK